MPFPAVSSAPLGATVGPGGTVFRLWVREAIAVHLVLFKPGVSALTNWAPINDNLRVKSGEYWSAFVAAVSDGWQCRYYTRGSGGQGLKRDQRTRELEPGVWPENDCIVRGPVA